MQLNASAPGSLMLLGEYGVLYGKHALVCAIDKRIHVTLTPRNDEKIIIQSALQGRYETNIFDLEIEKPFHFVLGVLKQYQGRLKRGCEIVVTSEFSDKIGLGSSAAVTVAVLAAVITWFNIRISALEMVRQGKIVVRHVQGMGSGADIAASVFGGIVSFQSQPLSAEKFSKLHPLTALYAGFKTPTATAIKQVQDYFLPYPNILRHLSNSIGQCALDGMYFVRNECWDRLGEVMNIQQGMMESLGISTPLLQNMVGELRKQSGILGAKISGSGLGDCVIGLGTLPVNFRYAGDLAGVQHIPVSMTAQGVQCEKS